MSRILSLSHFIFLFLQSFLGLSTAQVTDTSSKVPASSRPPASVQVRQIDANTIGYNGWEIADCGDIQVMPLELNDILAFLVILKPGLEAVIADARQGLRSPHGYTAFFKSATNIRQVILRYQLLVDVNPVIVSPERAKVINKHTPQPRFQCINENDPKTAETMEQCKRINQPMIVHSGTERISLCPLFFKLFQYESQPCPVVGGDGRFMPGDGSLMMDPFPYTVLALMQIYNREMGEAMKIGEGYDMQHAVDLDARQSLHHPENYGYYAGGKFRLSNITGESTANSICSRSDGVHDLSEDQRSIRWRVEDMTMLCTI
ncbi:MAG: hypothetical protein Q9215_005817 [Flavoplaca cf. flavocitrina]